MNFLTYAVETGWLVRDARDNNNIVDRVVTLTLWPPDARSREANCTAVDVCRHLLKASRGQLGFGRTAERTPIRIWNTTGIADPADIRNYGADEGARRLVAEFDPADAEAIFLSSTSTHPGRLQDRVADAIEAYEKGEAQ